LSLMYSCGMYNYSGQFAFKVGLPAKSGVSGCIMLVIPNLMGVALWSPPLDEIGNSVRGVQFCNELVDIFNFHRFDNIRNSATKLDPRREPHELRSLTTLTLLFSAVAGDVSSLHRHYLQGVDMTISDYDGRTALHLAAAEGQEGAVKFLLETCGVPPNPKDRWGHTPIGEARLFGHSTILKILETYCKDEKPTRDNVSATVKSSKMSFKVNESSNEPSKMEGSSSCYNKLKAASLGSSKVEAASLGSSKVEAASLGSSKVEAAASDSTTAKRETREAPKEANTMYSTGSIKDTLGKFSSNH